MVNGVRSDAVRGLAPRTCEGGVPALAQGRGEFVAHISFTNKNEE